MMVQDDQIDFRAMTESDARHAALLHIEGISTGFISSLGEKFVTGLYNAIIQRKDCITLAAIRNDQMIGFVTFAADMGKLIRSLMLRHGFRFMLPLMKKIFSIKTVKKIYENIFYSSRTEKMNLPPAELFSIVVSPDARGIGLGATLVKQGLSKCVERGIFHIKVLVAKDNKTANSMYKQCGFELAKSIDSHGVPSNIYYINMEKP